MPATLDGLNNHVLEDWHGINRICPRLAPWPWTIQLKSSRLPAYDHWYLDGYFPLIVWQYGVISTGQGEVQAEVRHVNQMAWHLNTLPSGTPGLKDIKSDKWTCPRIYWWDQKKDGHAWGALSNAHSTSVKVNYNTCCGRQYYRWTIVVLACICPLSPKLTSSKCSRFHCYWSLIAIHPGCPKLLLSAFWCIYGPLNLSKYCPQANTAWCKQPGLPTLSPVHCSVSR